MKKLSLLLAIALLLTWMPTITSAESTEEPFALRVMVPLIVTDVKADGWAVKKLEELTGIKLTYEIVNFSDYDTKINVMAAANTLPDILQIYTVSLERRLAAEGMLWELDGLLEEYGQNILDARSEPAELLQNYRDPHDGKLYSFPAVNDFNGQGNIIRADWLDNFGMNAPTTLDEYHTLARMFTFNDPDGNGIDDTYGIYAFPGSGLAPFMFVQQYYGVFDDFIMEVDGSVTYGHLMDGMKDVLRTVHEYYQEGLIDPDYLILPSNSEVEYQQSGKHGMYRMNLQRAEPNGVILSGIKKTQPAARFSVYEPPVSIANGEKMTPAPRVRSWISTTITKSCKQPEKAMQFLNTLMSEEVNNQIRYGEEGVMYDLVDGKVLFKNEWANADTRWLEGLEEQIIFPCYRDLYDEMAWSDEVLEGVRIDNECMIFQPFYPIGNEIIEQYSTSLTALKEEYFARMITEPGIDIDAVFAEFVQEYMNAGGDKVISELNRIYKEPKG